MNFAKHIISADASLREALIKLNDLSGGAMTLFAVDSCGNAVGSVTDGDVRRAMIAGAGPESPVHMAANRQFSYITTNLSAERRVAFLRDLRQQGITLVPVLDGHKIVELINLKNHRNMLPMSAVLMAGGKGERLRPLTLDTPKPLLHVGGKAIIDYNIEALAIYGVRDITVCTRYLADQIKAHFAKPVSGVDVKCVTEERPLGTFGAVTLADIPAKGNTLVMNSDLLTTIAYDDMYWNHVIRGADITVAAIPYQVSVPYALLDTRDSSVLGLSEKPTFSYFANAGIYIVRNNLIHAMPKDEHIDATDFIEHAIAKGLSVSYYVINGTWIDVGSPADLRRADELMKHYRNFLPAL